MTSLPLATVLKLAALICAAAIAAAAWTVYQSPALGLLLGLAPFCG